MCIIVLQFICCFKINFNFYVMKFTLHREIYGCKLILRQQGDFAALISDYSKYFKMGRYVYYVKHCTRLQGCWYHHRELPLRYFPGYFRYIHPWVWCGDKTRYYHNASPATFFPKIFAEKSIFISSHLIIFTFHHLLSTYYLIYPSFLAIIYPFKRI